MKNQSFYLPLALLASGFLYLVGLVSCSGGGPTEPDPKPSYTTTNVNIITNINSGGSVLYHSSNISVYSNVYLFLSNEGGTRPLFLDDDYLSNYQAPAVFISSNNNPNTNVQTNIRFSVNNIGNESVTNITTVTNTTLVHQTNQIPFQTYIFSVTNTNWDNRDLSSQDLRDLNLSHYSFSNANLLGANLSNANLSNANLSNANLTNANLTNIILSRENYFYLSQSSLPFTSANLRIINGFEILFGGCNQITTTYLYEDDTNILVFTLFETIYAREPSQRIVVTSSDGVLQFTKITPSPVYSVNELLFDYNIIKTDGSTINSFAITDERFFYDAADDCD